MSQLIIEDLKKITGDVIAKSAPADVVTGVVISVDPLEIEIDKNTEYYDPAVYIVPRSLTDYQCTVTVDGEDGDKLVTVKNAIQPGETLLMLRCMKGQKYLILDRMGVDNGES